MINIKEKIVELKNYRINRKHKDELFKRAFANKKDLLALYNALNKSDYNNENELIITTLEDAIYMSMKNDVSFIVASSLNLYEHQSTVNPNMPIRGFLYFAKLYEAYIKINKLDVYGKKLVKLPIPQYVVFYNGTEEQPDEVIYRLSDAFERDRLDMTPDLECTARVLNINYGHNKELLDTCERLNDYSYFIDKIKKNVKRGMDIENAIDFAMEDCIDKGILVDILEKQRSEVKSMLLFTYDEKLHKENEKRIAQEEGYAEGHAQGRAQGHAEGLAQGKVEGGLEVMLKLYKAGGISVKDASKILEISENDFEKKYEEWIKVD